jgi:hypothetical protein
MIQLIFLSLLVITLLAGGIAYFSPSKKPMNPLQFMMDNTGYTQEQVINQKRTEEINLTTDEGVVKVHKLMDDLATQQSKFLDLLKEQQRILEGAGKNASDVLKSAKKQGGKDDKDILQLEALTSQIQDSQRLMVQQGQALVNMNNQLMKNRKWMAEQSDIARINTESSLRSSQSRYDSLNGHANELYNAVKERSEISQQHIKDLIEQQRLKQENQQLMMEQRSNENH